jgi:thiamine pyrophosphate-dependent acetolactate synthase large subunit-like protein
MGTLRGCDVVMRALAQQGVRRVFTLSGNHVMSLFDAALDVGIELVHVRHEAAAVHMADAWGRLTGTAGVAMVTGGPGHANTVGALFGAKGAEAPLVLLSGHAATWELGRGGFQEVDQAAMAKPAAKMSWMVAAAANLRRDVETALRVAAADVPGPVHVSLPSDLLEAKVEDFESLADAGDPLGPQDLPAKTLAAVLDLIARAARPLILAGPALSNPAGRTLLARLEAALGAPVALLESPRGLADATLGNFAAVTKRADLIVLLGKALDFTAKWLAPPAFDAASRVIAFHPHPGFLDRAEKELTARLVLRHLADTKIVAEQLIGRAKARDGGWRTEVRAALDFRPPAWARLRSSTPNRLHPAEVFRALTPLVDRDDAVLVCDGGEFAQWGYGLLPVRRRLINGVTGGIGSALSFALAARLFEPKGPVIAVLGDGTIGFHLAEFETAVRQRLPFIAVLGNDARWNAESQIQLREYGAQRMHSCELLPARYDQVVEAFGGHGALVTTADQLPVALDRALASNKPACVNVMLESVAAPSLK